jgi:hypothetical protein
MTTTIPIEEMMDKLLTVEQLYAELETTEPLSEVEFETGDQVGFVLGEDSLRAPVGDTEQVDAVVSINGTEYPMSKEALLEATSKCGIPKGYAQRTPADLIELHLNYWFREGLCVGGRNGKPKQHKALAAGGDQLIVGFTGGQIRPFSNLQLLDTAVTGARQHYGAALEDLRVDYKRTHSLRLTEFRLIVPDYTRSIVSGRDSASRSDQWSAGLQVRNSLTGEDSTVLDGYLFAWWCTNGCTNTYASSGRWSRRGGGGNDANEVYDWAAQSVEQIFIDLESSFDEVQSLTEVPIRGDVVNALSSIYERYGIPAVLRDRITEAMVESSDLTMYGIMNAITSVANDGVSARQATTLMEAAGELPRVYGNARVAFEAIETGHLDLSGEVEITLPNGDRVPTRVTKIPAAD